MSSTAQRRNSQYDFYQQAIVQAAVFRLSLVQQIIHSPERFTEELPNIWSMVQSCYERGDWSLLLSYCDLLLPVLDKSGAWEQSLTLLNWAYDAATHLGAPQTAARCLHNQGDMFNQQGQYRAAEQRYLAAEQAYQLIDDAESALKSRHMRSMVVRALGRLGEAAQLNRMVLDEAEAQQLGSWYAHPLYVQGLLARDRNDYVEAQQAVRAGLTLLSATDELAMIAQCHHFLGEIALLEGNRVVARRELEESVRLSEQAGIRRRVAATQRLLGDLARLEGQESVAEHWYQSAIDIAGTIGDQSQLARLLLARSTVSARQRDLAQSGALLRSALTIYEQIGDQRGVVVASVLLARIEFQQRQMLKALARLARALRSAWQSRLLNPRLLMSMWRQRRAL